MSNSKDILENSSFLDLPDADDFISKPIKLSVADVIKQCEQMLPIWNVERFNRLEKEEKENNIKREPFYL